MIALNRFKKILEDNEERFPLLTLDEFFKGNTEEDSIAPNQWEEGRPSLAEIWDMLRKIELMSNIAWVRVALHDDTQIEEDDEKEVLTLAGDSIVPGYFPQQKGMCKNTYTFNHFQPFFHR